MPITNEQILHYKNFACKTLDDKFEGILKQGEIYGEDAPGGRRFMGAFHLRGTNLGGKGRDPFTVRLMVTIVAEPNE